MAEMVRRAVGRRASTEGRGKGGWEARRDGSGRYAGGVLAGAAAAVVVVGVVVAVVVAVVPAEVELIGGSCGLNNWLRTAAAPSVPPRDAGWIGAGCAGPG